MMIIEKKLAAGQRTDTRLSPRGTFFLLISIVVSFLAGSIAPTPLYATYQAAWGFSPITTTVIFGVYAIAVLIALLTVGSLSDQVGRRPVLLAATLIQAGVMLVFTSAHGVTDLVVARVVQGLATGAAIAAVGAGLLDVDRARGTLANAVGPMVGTATGGIVSGLVVQYLPAPTHLIYLILFGVFLLQSAGVVLMPELVSPQPGALHSFKPHFALPRAARRPFVLVAPVAVAAWSLAGFYGSLGPTLLRRMVGSQSPALGGLAMFALAGGGVLSVLAIRNRGARTLLTVGSATLLSGVGLTLNGVASGSIGVFFAGTVLAGAGFGAGFQGVIRTVVPLAAAHERAGVLSVLYVVSYLAMGAPAVVAGFLVVHGGGVLVTAREYGAFVMSLAAVALVGVIVEYYRDARQVFASLRGIA
jgi:MFS family permease